MLIVSVFGSSRIRSNDAEYRIAHELGSLLAISGFTVCNGGYGGSMEAVAKGAKDSGGTTIGIVTEMFGTKTNPFIDQVVVTKTHADRLLKLVETGDAYIVLKGSTGTLLELAMVWEYANKGIMKNKPILVLGDFWQPVIDTLKSELAWEGAKDAAGYVAIVRSPQECISVLKRRLYSP